MAEHHMHDLRRGSFADGQAVTEAGLAPVGRFSLGQEQGPGIRPTTGSFADGQALRHPAPLPRGRFSTGQERGEPRRRTVVPASTRSPERRPAATASRR